tara:strand:+ start:172 stop:1089 length:918 start_codon:yes stop_codon:yes gene_type:complete
MEIDVESTKINTKYQIHYYFIDDSHSMNALVRNKAEKDFLEAISNIAELLEINSLSIDTEAYNEGGLKENLLITGFVTTIGFLSPSINNLISYYFTNEHIFKEEQIKNLRLDSKLKEIEIEEKLSKINENKTVIRNVSNFYTKVNGYEKIREIGFFNFTTKQEIKIEKKYFKDFILEDKTTIEVDEVAEISIISPVLNMGTYKWKGLYKGVEISFSMGDTKFKTDVLNKKYKFSNGSFILCVLQITTKFDEDGEIINKPHYSVSSVLVVNDSIGDNRITTRGYKRKKMQRNNLQASLFDELKDKN